MNNLKLNNTYNIVFLAKRLLLAQFRMGVLHLAIETGRFKSIHIEERVCVLCNMNDIEDEIHILYTCTLYEHIRIDMYNNVINKNVNFHQQNDEQNFIYLVTTE